MNMICKNCGVKLDASLIKCPLCGEKVRNNNSYNSLYSMDVEYLAKDISIMYFAKLVILILFLSTIVTIICNLAIDKKISWSFYVIFSFLFISSHYFYLVSSRRKVCFIINTISLELLLFMIAYLNNGLNWYLYLVGPFILIGSLFVLFITFISKFKNILRNISYFILYVAISLILINGLISLFITSKFNLSWSYYSLISLFIVSMILFILSFNKKCMTEVEKRLFI